MRASFCAIIAMAALNGCVPIYEQHEIAQIHAVGITGGRSAGDEAYQQIESTLEGLSAIFRKRGFATPAENWAHDHGKRFEYGYHLSGERIYWSSYLYSGVKQTIVQSVIEIDRKQASLRFIESEWPQKSGMFPMSETQRQYMRDTARIVADYLRRRLPSHNVELSIDEQPPRSRHTMQQGVERPRKN